MVVTPPTAGGLELLPAGAVVLFLSENLARTQRDPVPVPSLPTVRTVCSCPPWIGCEVTSDGPTLL